MHITRSVWCQLKGIFNLLNPQTLPISTASSLTKKGKGETLVRSYDVYERDDPSFRYLRARIRVQDDGQIEWAFRPQGAAWPGFWWSDHVKSEIVRTIKEYPQLAAFSLGGFAIRLREKE